MTLPAVTFHAIRGLWMDDQGLCEPGWLDIIREGDEFQDDMGGVLTVSRFEVTTGVWDHVIKSSLGAWKFVPNDGQCRRIGISVPALTDAP
jgi:hypothetical protein